MKSILFLTFCFLSTSYAIIQQENNIITISQENNQTLTLTTPLNVRILNDSSLFYHGREAIEVESSDCNIINRGYLQGEPAIKLSSGVENCNIINYSSIEAINGYMSAIDFSLSSGNNSITLENNSTIHGSIIGSSFNDTITLKNSGELTDNISSFTYLKKQQQGTWVVNTGNNITKINIEDGQLIVNGLVTGNNLLNNPLITLSKGTLNVTSSGRLDVYPTNIENGNFILDGILSTENMTISENGYLSGQGQITKIPGCILTLTNYGTITPGNNKNYSLNIGGNVIFKENSTLEINLQNNQATSIVVSNNGNVELNGNLEIFSNTSSLPITNNSFTIISTNGNISGEFNNILSSSAVLDFSCKKTDGSLNLNVERSPYLNFANTFNQQLLANILDKTFDQAENGFANMLCDLDFIPSTQLSTAYDELLPYLYLTSNYINLKQLDLLNTYLIHFLSSQRFIKRKPLLTSYYKEEDLLVSLEDEFILKNQKTKQINQRTLSPFLQVFSSFNQGQNTEQRPGYNMSSFGLFTGLDIFSSDKFKTCIFGGYEYLNFSIKNNFGKGETSSYKIGTSTFLSSDNYNLDLILMGEANILSNKRKIDTLNRYPHSNYNIYSGAASLFYEYQFAIAKSKIGPQLGLEYLYSYQSSFKEKMGAGSNLKILSNDNKNLISIIGMIVSFINSNDKTTTDFNIFCGWKHNYLPSTLNLQSHFIDFPNDVFAISSNMLDENYFYYGLSLNLISLKKQQISISYYGEKDKGFNNIFSLSIKRSF